MTTRPAKAYRGS